jgi:hypothetical protein
MYLAGVRRVEDSTQALWGTAMLKAVHAQEDAQAAREKAERRRSAHEGLCAVFADSLGCSCEINYKRPKFRAICQNPGTPGFVNGQSNALLPEMRDTRFFMRNLFQSWTGSDIQ